MAPRRSLGGPGAPKSILNDLGVHLGTHFGSQNRKMEPKLFENKAPVLNVIFGNLGGSWARFGVDFGVMLGSFFGPQLENRIL